MYFVYILQCNDDTFYTGSTVNLEKRLIEHNTKKNGAHYTKIRRPVHLVHCEQCSSYSEARRREAEIKRLDKKAKIALIGSTA